MVFLNCFCYVITFMKLNGSGLNDFVCLSKTSSSIGEYWAFIKRRDYGSGVEVQRLRFERLCLSEQTFIEPSVAFSSTFCTFDNSNTALYLSASVDRALFRPIFFPSYNRFLLPFIPRDGAQRWAMRCRFFCLQIPHASYSLCYTSLP